MKVLRSSLFRAVCSLIVGVLLIQYPDATVTWITIAIGVLFLLSGVISCATYFNAVRTASAYKITDADGRVVSQGRPPLPVVGLGSLILGALLAIKPAMFVAGLMYVLGAILILGAINQFMALLAARRYGRAALTDFTADLLRISIEERSGRGAGWNALETAVITLLARG